MRVLGERLEKILLEGFHNYILLYYWRDYKKYANSMQ